MARELGVHASHLKNSQVWEERGGSRFGRGVYCVRHPCRPSERGIHAAQEREGVGWLSRGGAVRRGAGRRRRSARGHAARRRRPAFVGSWWVARWWPVGRAVGAWTRRPPASPVHLCLVFGRGGRRGRAGGRRVDTPPAGIARAVAGEESDGRRPGPGARPWGRVNTAPPGAPPSRARTIQ